VAGQFFQIQHLRTFFTQGLQQARLARSGRAADHPEVQPRDLRRQVGQQGRAKRLVATFEQMHPKADLAQDQRQRVAALAAAPAVDQGLPVLGFVQDLALDMGGNIAGDQGGTDLLRFERADLLVQGADAHALGVVQRRPVERAGQVVLGVFALAARIDDRAEAFEPGHGLGGRDRMHTHLSSFRSSGQTLARMMGCASCVG
jgi:hypothetical protein